MEAKFAQQLAFLEQDALYEIFIDLKKAYNAIDCKKRFEILKEYGVGSTILRLIKYFW